MKMLTLKQILAGCSVLCCLLIATESRAVDVGDVFIVTEVSAPLLPKMPTNCRSDWFIGLVPAKTTD